MNSKFFDLAKEKQDASCMSREEFFERVENAEKTPSLRFENIDELDQYIRSL